jgi:hypothetical protein
MRRSRAWRIGALTATIVVLQQALMGRAVVGLSVALALAAAVCLARPPLPAARADRLLLVFAVGVAVQILHFAEEWATGFAREFPALLGYEWSDRRFVSFNVAWVLAFAAAALGVQRRSPEAFLVLWFFAFDAIGNAVLHVSIAVWRRAYFPGVVTAPLLLVVGVLLLQQLLQVTRAAPPGDGSRSPRP